MLIGFIKHNRSVSIVLLPISMILIWGYGFFHPVVPDMQHAAPLYKLLISGVRNFPFLITLISFLLILAEALLINHIIEKNEIIDTTTYLPGLVYIILMSLQPEMFSCHPIVIANLFMLLAVHKLMQTYRKETAYSEVFNTGFFISLATLIYFPSVFFILLIWIGLIIMRPIIWREWAISFIGFTLPWIYLFFYYFWNDAMDMLEYDALYYAFVAPGKTYNFHNFSYVEYIQFGILLLCAFFSSGRVLADVNKGTVHTRSNLFLMIYFFLIAFISIFLAPAYSIAYLSFLAIPFTVFFSSFLLFTRKGWFAETLFLLLILSVFANQMF